MLTVGKDGSVIENLKKILEKYLKGASPKYYPPVENLLDLIYEHYTENNSVAPQTTEAGKDAKRKEKDLETWLRGIAGMDVLVEDYGGDIPLWEKIMDRQGSVCCAWEKTAFEESGCGCAGGSWHIVCNEKSPFLDSFFKSTNFLILPPKNFIVCFSVVSLFKCHTLHSVIRNILIRNIEISGVLKYMEDSYK